MKLTDMHKPICTGNWQWQKARWQCWAYNTFVSWITRRRLGYIAEALRPGYYKLIWRK